MGVPPRTVRVGVSALTDLAVFWPKIKAGGILAGHDFRDSAVQFDGSNDWIVLPDGTRHPEGKAVRGAVLDFAAAVGRQVVVMYEDPAYPSWMMRR